MHSSGLPIAVSALLKLGAFDMGGGAWTTVRGRCSGELIYVGSEDEWACLPIGRAAMGSLYGLGLDRAETEDERDTGKELGAIGHRGLLESVIWLEILSVLIVLAVELERLKLGLPFLFIESVSFVRLVSEKARDLRGRAVSPDDLRGGVI